MTVKMFINRSRPEGPILHILSDTPHPDRRLPWNHIYVGPNRIMSNEVDINSDALRGIILGMQEIPEKDVIQALQAIREVLINHE